MTQPIHDPHDSFFRETFSRTEVAEGFLQAYLPPEIVRAIDWSSLEIAKDSFVEKVLRKHFSDLLYSVRQGGREVKIYLLFEHKSSEEHWVALQLLRYQVRIFELHRKQHPGQPLSPIIPLVLYHGKPRWRVPFGFQSLFGELSAELAAYVPNFRYTLCNLNLPEPERIRDAVLCRAVFLALKHIFDPEPKRALAEILPLIREILNRETALEMLEVVLRYYVQATQRLDESDICQLITETSHGEDYMQTFIDRYIEQGRQQGLFAGRKEGRREGHREGRREGQREERENLLIRLMQRKFGPLGPEYLQRIHEADGEVLLRWTEQVLFANTPDEAMK
jgi:predicted transposase/invertase (TIGR01784 family)